MTALEKKKPRGLGAASMHSAEPTALNGAINPIIARLQRVRRYGQSYRADCPNGHRTARGSLSLMERSDGAVVLHCFACGDTPAILASIGLTLADLYPRPLGGWRGLPAGERRWFAERSAWAAATSVLDRESAVVCAAAAVISGGNRLADADLQRLRTAEQRIREAREVVR